MGGGVEIKRRPHWVTPTPSFHQETCASALKQEGKIIWGTQEMGPFWMRANSDQNQTKMAAVLRVLEDHQLSPFCWFLFYLVALIPTWETQIFSTKNSNTILDTLCPPTHQILKQTPYKQDFATITSHRRNPWHAASRRRSQGSNPEHLLQASRW